MNATLANKMRHGVYMSGYPSERSHGYDVCDESTSPLVVVAWRDTLDEAELEAARLNARPEVESTPRFVVTRHPQGVSSTTYRVIDTAANQTCLHTSFVQDSLNFAWLLNRGQQPTTDETGPEGSDVPPEAHAALDAMLADGEDYSAGFPHPDDEDRIEAILERAAAASATNAKACDCDSPHNVDEPGLSRSAIEAIEADLRLVEAGVIRA